MHEAICADTLRPTSRMRALMFDLATIVGGSLVLALSAQLSMRLPISPVPITAQTLAVLLLGALLGRRRGALAVLAYIGQGAMGLPVFAGGMGGVACVLGPTGGYLVGFAVAAFAVGALAERGWDRRFATTTAAMLVGTLIMHAFGVAWLSVYLGPARAVLGGVVPFIAGDLLKLLIAASSLPMGWKVLSALRSHAGE